MSTDKFSPWMFIWLFHAAGSNVEDGSKHVRNPPETMTLKKEGDTWPSVPPGAICVPSILISSSVWLFCSPPQICTHLGTAQHTTTSIWWCAATVARWWSLRPLRSTVRGGTVLSRRCADSLLLQPPSSAFVLRALLQITPPLERGGKTADAMKPVSPPLPLPPQHHRCTSTGLARPSRTPWGTVYNLIFGIYKNWNMNYLILEEA